MSEEDKKFITNWFAEYRKLNQEYLTKYTEIILLVENFSKYEDITTNDLFDFTNKTLGNKNSSGVKLKELHSILKINSVRIISICKELVNLINEENEELGNHLKGVISEEAGSVRTAELFLSNHNEKRSNFESILKSILGDWIKTGTMQFKIADLTIEDSLKSFVNFYNDLVKGINNSSIEKGALFLLLIKMSNYLGQYIKSDDSIHSTVIQELYSKIGSENTKAEEFASKFFGAAGSSGENLIQELNIWIEKTKNKGYSGLDKDDGKNELDKFMKEILKKLFSDNDEIKDKIDKIFGKKKDDDEIWTDYYKFKDDEVESKFDEKVSELKLQLRTILSYFEDDEENLKENSNEGFNETKKEIINILKVLGKNLKEYKKKISMEDSDFSILKLGLITNIENWENVTSKKKSVKGVVNSTRNLFEL